MSKTTETYRQFCERDNVHELIKRLEHNRSYLLVHDEIQMIVEMERELSLLRDENKKLREQLNS